MAFLRHRQVEAARDSAGHLREVRLETAGAQDTVAAELSRTRLARGLELDEIAGTLRIHRRQLQAIEEGRYDDLPGPAYAVGFLRSYAAFLGLDADDVVKRFKAEIAGFAVRQKLEFPSPAEEGRVPTAPLLFVALALFVAAYLGWDYVNSIDRIERSGVPEVPPTLAAQAPPPEPASAPPVTVAGVAGTPPTAETPETIEAAPLTPGGAEAEPAADTTVEIQAPVSEPPMAEPLAAESPPAEPLVAESLLSEPPAAEPLAAESPAIDVAAVEVSAEPGVETAAPGVAGVESGAAGETAAGETSAAPPHEVAAAPAAATPPPAQERAPAESAIAAVAPPVPPPAVATPAYVPRVYGRGNIDSRIVIRATQESWVQVTSVDDELLLTRKLYPGDVYRVPNRAGLILMTGNAGALEITVDGKPAPPLGPLGEVRRDIPLDAEKLLAGLGAAP